MLAIMLIDPIMYHSMPESDPFYKILKGDKKDMPKALTIDTTSSGKNSWFHLSYTETFAFAETGNEVYQDDFSELREGIITRIKDRHAEADQPEDHFAIIKLFDSNINSIIEPSSSDRDNIPLIDQKMDEDVKDMRILIGLGFKDKMTIKSKTYIQRQRTPRRIAWNQRTWRNKM